MLGLKFSELFCAFLRAFLGGFFTLRITGNCTSRHFIRSGGLLYTYSCNSQVMKVQFKVRF